jgi:predicted lipoprotein with Yx(FWY)xxD motif
MKKTLTLIAITIAAATAQADPTKIADGIVVSTDGKALYTFDKDSTDKSNCNGGCAAAWPPFTVANSALADGEFSIVKREDGASQWAFQGKPLYFYAGDTKPGEVNGDGKNGVWHVIRRAPAKTSRAKAPAVSYSGSPYDYSY